MNIHVKQSLMHAGLPQNYFKQDICLSMHSPFYQIFQSLKRKINDTLNKIAWAILHAPLVSCKHPVSSIHEFAYTWLHACLGSPQFIYMYINGPECIYNMHLLSAHCVLTCIGDLHMPYPFILTLQFIRWRIQIFPIVHDTVVCLHIHGDAGTKFAYKGYWGIRSFCHICISACEDLHAGMCLRLDF